jgi:copper(I)-binding protein
VKDKPLLQRASAAENRTIRSEARTQARTWVAVALAGLLAVSGLGGSLAAYAHDYQLGDVAIGHIWAPPTSEDGAGVYVAIMNQGAQPERLIGGSSAIADAVRLRAVENGQLRWLEAIDIAPGKVVALAPWRAHLWLAGLKRPLKEGDSFELTLYFAPAGAVTVTVVVEAAAGH